MILPDRIPVVKELIPYQFDIELAGEVFNLRFDYNALHDFYTVTLSKGGEVVHYGSPLIYGQRLFAEAYMNNGKFPACDIIPLDLSGEVDVVNQETFCEKVFLWIDNGEEALLE